uniref:DUF834 domain-containing protein n=1 Tax=Oryza punctata TaxID=4537 RepID=A0A0E0MNS9_ORYPU
MSSAAATARRGATANGRGWLHAAWLALTGGAGAAAAAAADMLTTTEEVAGGGRAARSGSRYELVSTEEPDGDGDETRWESNSGPASEAELFIVAREEDLTTNSPESIFACDELRVSRPEFWRWSAKKSGATGEPAVAESSEPFLTRRRGGKRVNDAEMEDHPFSFGRHGRMESSSPPPFLLLSSSWPAAS